MLSLTEDQGIEQLTRLIFALINDINLDEVCLQLLERDLYDVFLDLEMLCSQSNNLDSREKLIKEMFIQVLKNDCDAIALHMCLTFESLMLRNAGTFVPIILNRM